MENTHTEKERWPVGDIDSVRKRHEAINSVDDMIEMINFIIGPGGDIDVGDTRCYESQKGIFTGVIKKDERLREIFGKALQLFAPFLLNLSKERLRNLIDLIEFSEMPPDIYKDSFLQKVNGEAQPGCMWSAIDDDNLFNMALILRHLGEARYLSKKRILQEKTIREKEPWLWIDAVEPYSFDEVVKAIKCLAEKEQKKRKYLSEDMLDEILSRVLLCWDHRRDLKEALEVIKEVRQIIPISKKGLREIKRCLGVYE